MTNTIVVPVKYYVSILIMDPTLSKSAYLAWIIKYFNIDKQYQHYQIEYKMFQSSVWQQGFHRTYFPLDQLVALFGVAQQDITSSL